MCDGEAFWGIYFIPPVVGLGAVLGLLAWDAWSI